MFISFFGFGSLPFIERLPTCRNDHGLSLVLRKLKTPSHSKWYDVKKGICDPSLFLLNYNCLGEIHGLWYDLRNRKEYRVDVVFGRYLDNDRS